MSLRNLQSEFVRAFGRLIGFVYAKGWELTLGEGFILQRGPDGKGRKAKHLVTGLTLKVKDAVHMEDGQHYKALAVDLNLFINGVWISSGDHPAWRELGDFWKGLHVDARWGGDFDSVDVNHFSFTYQGKA